MNQLTYLLRLDRLATTCNTWMAYIPFAAVGTWLMVADARLQRMAHGLPKLDFRLHGYSAADVSQLFTAYGASGRAEYWQQTVVDSCFPFLLAAFGVLFFSRTYRRWGWTKLGNLLIGISLLFMVVDVAENILIFALLRQYPHPGAGTVAAASFLTQLKLPLILTIYLFVLLNTLVLMGKWLASWWRALASVATSAEVLGSGPRS
jgi:hypothetical protein